MKPENAVEKAILENGIGMFAICADSENAFTYWIAGLYKGGEVPGGLELYSFPASEWAVFTTKGPMPASLQTLNTAVWQEWFPNEGQKYHANGNATQHWRCILPVIRSHRITNAEFGCRSAAGETKENGY